MKPSLTGYCTLSRLISLLLLILSVSAHAQFGPPRPPLGEGPWEFMTFENQGLPIKVSVVTRGISHPWSMLWLPDGDMLITEREGRLRLLHNGVLLSDPLERISDLKIDRFFDIALHPDFEENG